VDAQRTGWLAECLLTSTDHPTPTGHLFPPKVRVAHPFGGEKVHWTFSFFRLTLENEEGSN